VKSTVQREWFTISEVQELLGIGSTKAYELVQTGELPAIRIGRSLRVHRRDIEEWAEKNRYIT
jgi:excisionase family DNA binding protein